LAIEGGFGYGAGLIVESIIALPLRNSEVSRRYERMDKLENHFRGQSLSANNA